MEDEKYSTAKVLLFQDMNIFDETAEFKSKILPKKAFSIKVKKNFQKKVLFKRILEEKNAVIGFSECSN